MSAIGDSGLSIWVPPKNIVQRPLGRTESVTEINTQVLIADDRERSRGPFGFLVGVTSGCQ